MRGRRRDGSIDWYWIIVTGGTLAGCLIIILIMALWLAACPGAAEGAFPEPDGPWVAYEPEGYDGSAPPFYPILLPPWDEDDPLIWWPGAMNQLHGSGTSTEGLCIYAIPMTGRGLVRCCCWPVSMQLRREKP